MGCYLNVTELRTGGFVFMNKDNDCLFNVKFLIVIIVYLLQVVMEIHLNEHTDVACCLNDVVHVNSCFICRGKLTEVKHAICSDFLVGFPF